MAALVVSLTVTSCASTGGDGLKALNAGKNQQALTLFFVQCANEGDAAFERAIDAISEASNQKVGGPPNKKARR